MTRFKIPEGWIPWADDAEPMKNQDNFYLFMTVKSHSGGDAFVHTATYSQYRFNRAFGGDIVAYRGHYVLEWNDRYVVVDRRTSQLEYKSFPYAILDNHWSPPRTIAQYASRIMADDASTTLNERDRKKRG